MLRNLLPFLQNLDLISALSAILAHSNHNPSHIADSSTKKPTDKMLPLHIHTLLLLLLTPLTQATPSLTFVLPAPPPASTLPPSTHASLRTLHTVLQAPLSRNNALNFNNVSTGTYILDIHCPTHRFPPLRIDVSPHGAHACHTFRGNAWAERGEAIPPRADAHGSPLPVWTLPPGEPKVYLEARAGFSPLSLLKNPMILIGAVSLAVVLGMPYLLENLDPEMRKELEEQQKKGPLGGVVGPAAGGFDVAAWMAGKTPGKAQAGSAAGARKKRA
ncbi:MAG: hypothetical protein M1829_000039 [Trizodia sp. TS-e1964]|nr:MAG: hypothetical protein M1829_000039 [Trizodia sp. TS-e1964]